MKHKCILKTHKCLNHNIKNNVLKHAYYSYQPESHLSFCFPHVLLATFTPLFALESRSIIHSYHYNQFLQFTFTLQSFTFINYSYYSELITPAPPLTQKAPSPES